MINKVLWKEGNNSRVKKVILFLLLMIGDFDCGDDKKKRSKIYINKSKREKSVKVEFSLKRPLIRENVNSKDNGRKRYNYNY